MVMGWTVEVRDSRLGGGWRMMNVWSDTRVVPLLYRRLKSELDFIGPLGEAKIGRATFDEWYSKIHSGRIYLDGHEIHVERAR